MREVHVDIITEKIRQAVITANLLLPFDILEAVRKGKMEEESEWGRHFLQVIEENAELAAREELPLCQDTGITVIDMEIGQDVHITGGLLEEAVNEGIRRGYRDGYLRSSMVADPLNRVNTGDNTPGVIHCRLVAGDRIRVVVFPKGGGSENMGRVAMLKPAAGWEGIKETVVKAVAEAGSNPCPPVVVGVGVGGTMELAAYLSKKALFRPIDVPHPDPKWADRERELLAAVNETGIGPQGFGGRITALGVNIEVAPTHIACLPVAVNLGCHITRRVIFEI